MPIKWERPKAEQLVQELYRRLFDRAPEREVLRGLVGYFVDGHLSARIQLMRMLKSEEFFDKKLRDKTPEAMARELHMLILGRPPESEESMSGAAASIVKLGWQVQVDVMINCEEFIGQFGDDTLPGAPAPDDSLPSAKAPLTDRTPSLKPRLTRNVVGSLT